MKSVFSMSMVFRLLFVPLSRNDHGQYKGYFECLKIIRNLVTIFFFFYEKNQQLLAGEYSGDQLTEWDVLYNPVFRTILPALPLVWTAKVVYLCFVFYSMQQFFSSFSTFIKEMEEVYINPVCLAPLKIYFRVVGIIK